MRRSTFVKHIDSLNEEELRGELLHLFNKVKEVKAFYAMELGSEKDRKKLYENAKASIVSKYKTKSFRKPRRPRIQKINALLKDMEKKAIFNWEMIDLYLFNVEKGIEFMRAYSFYSEPLKNTIMNSLQKALGLIEESLFQEECKDRVELIIDQKIFEYALQAEIVRAIRKVYPN